MLRGRYRLRSIYSIHTRLVSSVQFCIYEFCRDTLSPNCLRIDSSIIFSAYSSFLNLCRKICGESFTGKNFVCGYSCFGEKSVCFQKVRFMVHDRSYMTKQASIRLLSSSHTAPDSLIKKVMCSLQFPL